MIQPVPQEHIAKKPKSRMSMFTMPLLQGETHTQKSRSRVEQCRTSNGKLLKRSRILSMSASARELKADDLLEDTEVPHLASMWVKHRNNIPPCFGVSKEAICLSSICCADDLVFAASRNERQSRT